MIKHTQTIRRLFEYVWPFYGIGALRVNNLDVKPFLDDNSTLSCDCTSSPFVDQDHSHIIRGNLKIIDNNKLRNLSLNVQSTVKMELLNIKKLVKA